MQMLAVVGLFVCGGSKIWELGIPKPKFYPRQGRGVGDSLILLLVRVFGRKRKGTDKGLREGRRRRGGCEFGD